jgi:hypothetical protein
MPYANTEAMQQFLVGAPSDGDQRFRLMTSSRTD